MAEESVRCPYCVFGDEFRPMLRRAEGWFICELCYHVVLPDDPGFRCAGENCQKAHRAA